MHLSEYIIDNYRFIPENVTGAVLGGLPLSEKVPGWEKYGRKPRN
jgi:hypothetical protein